MPKRALPGPTLPEPIRTETDALQRPQVAAAYADVTKALDELGDLFRSAESLPRAAFPVVIRDAQKRTEALRKLLGL